MELYYEKRSLDEEEMRRAMRKGMVARDLFPIFCVSAEKDMGVRRLMEFLGNIVPFVSEMPKPVDKNGTEVVPDAKGPASIFVFKTSIEPHLGEVSYFKVMSGTVKEEIGSASCRERV